MHVHRGINGTVLRNHDKHIVKLLSDISCRDLLWVTVGLAGEIVPFLAPCSIINFHVSPDYYDTLID